MGRELWKSDGTESGTVQVADLFPGDHDYYGVRFGNGSFPDKLTSTANGTLFFVASDPDHGRELWTSDGTESGTRIVKDIVPGGGDVTQAGPFGGDGGAAPNSADPMALTDLDGKLYFIANDVEHGSELWVTDGSEAGTRIVKDINPGNAEGVSPRHGFAQLTVHGDKVYFFADDGQHGTEVWSSDGTEAGTQMVRDINPGPAASFNPLLNPFFLKIESVGDEVAFSADDGVHGYELWLSDGTEQGAAGLSPTSVRARPVPNLTR